MTIILAFLTCALLYATLLLIGDWVRFLGQATSADYFKPRHIPAAREWPVWVIVLLSGPWLLVLLQVMGFIK